MTYAARAKQVARVGAMLWLASTLLLLVHAASIPYGVAQAGGSGENILQAAIVADLGVLPSRPGGDSGTSLDGQAGSQRLERVAWSLGPLSSGFETVLVASSDSAVRTYLRLGLEREPGQPVSWAACRTGNSESEPPCC